jgi:activating signal cointegrator complex subunit 3
LPQGSEKKTGLGFEEIFIPATRKVLSAIEKQQQDDELININTLENFAQQAFIGTKKLNLIQSKVFNCAYNSNENMLVCAPTGFLIYFIFISMYFLILLISKNLKLFIYLLFYFIY